MGHNDRKVVTQTWPFFRHNAINDVLWHKMASLTIKKLEETENITDLVKLMHHCIVRTAENIARVKESVANNMNL